MTTTRRRFLAQSALAAAALGLPGRPAEAALSAQGLREFEAARPLSGAQRALLADNGFVILEDGMPSFGTAYEWLYWNDLPLFVSADSMLHAVHRSYDDVLKALEEQELIRRLEAILAAMRRDLGGGEVLAGMDRATVADIDLYLAVALSLLSGQAVPLVAGGDAAALSSLLALAAAHAGISEVRLFGTQRLVDASQLTPRGHYTDSVALTRYFQAMMWLGRIDLRLIEPIDGRMVFQRRQFDAAVGLRLLMDQPTHESWLVLDRTIGAFVGPYDSLDPVLLDDLMAELEIDGPAALAAVSDAQAQAALDALPGGEQRILSHLVHGDPEGGTQPLARTFLLLGQRYTIDSHVLSLLVYDRVGGGKIPRLMPSPLDVAYVVMGSDAAEVLLAPELARYPYQGDLADAREMVAAREGWTGSLYDAWLAALRTLSAEDPGELPAVARTEAWQRRILNTQLASWAELRHDTILYAKQSYTSMISCEHPDAWVDPYPRFYDALVEYADKGLEVADALALSGELGEAVRGHFERLRAASANLGEIARAQAAGERISDRHLRFINDVVRRKTEGCGELVGAEGWYPELFLRPIRSMEYDPTIADVHTQPTDEHGNVVGRILHVGTAAPRLCVVVVETCDGPALYAGVVSAWREVVTENFDRLDDIRWASMAQTAAPPPWLAALCAG